MMPRSHGQRTVGRFGVYSKAHACPGEGGVRKWAVPGISASDAFGFAIYQEARKSKGGKGGKGPGCGAVIGVIAVMIVLWLIIAG